MSLVGPICDGRLWRNGRIIKHLVLWIIETKQKLDGYHVDELGTSTGPWPRYLVMTATDKGNPSTTFHLLLYTRLLRVFLGVTCILLVVKNPNRIID